MFHTPLYDSDICGDPPDDEGGQGWAGATGLHPITPSLSAAGGIACAPSLSCFSIELQNGYELSLEKALASSLLTVEDTLALLRPEQALLKPKGMEMAPYRSMGCGMHVMAERALLCEWSLFHNFRLGGTAMLPPRPASPIALLPGPKGAGRAGDAYNPHHRRSPSLHQRRLSRCQVRADGVSMSVGPPDAHPIEASHGGFVEPSDVNTPAPALGAVEEVISESKPCALDLSGLQRFMTARDEARIHRPWAKTRRRRYHGPKHENRFDAQVEKTRASERRRMERATPLEAFVQEVAEVVARGVWEADVVPELAPLIPPQGISVVKRVRCSTANSSETDCSAKHSLVTSNATQKGPPFLQRPHTGEPRTRYWVPDSPLSQDAVQPSQHPMPSPTTTRGHAQAMQFPTAPEVASSLPQEAERPGLGRVSGANSRNGRYNQQHQPPHGGYEMHSHAHSHSAQPGDMDGEEEEGPYPLQPTDRVATPEGALLGPAHPPRTPQCGTPPEATARVASSSDRAQEAPPQRGHAKSPSNILTNITTSCNTKDAAKDEKGGKERRRTDGTRNGGKKKEKKNRKNSKTQRPVRLDEYVLEQNRLFQQGLSPYGMDKALEVCEGVPVETGEEFALPPLYPTSSDGVAIVTVSDSFDAYPYLDPDPAPPHEEEPHHASITPTMRESPIDGCLPTILAGKPLAASTVASRFDWPVRAQTAIPSHARAIRMQQQYIPSRER
eukprot:TRINITY_DN5053_c0_g2_i1.p1 TRINITY_DN5053_c0_g2~~TRINITY_DN5053_c0_g2_i1.p1  ORF type:complete len:727 (+),score=197.63 TRINITY_DN5053_c0_g2_i1:149-2329(+)